MGAGPTSSQSPGAVEALRQILDIVLHLNRHLAELVADYGPWVYGILFLIVFCETGLVVTPFLPGTRCCSPPGRCRRPGR